MLMKSLVDKILKAAARWWPTALTVALILYATLAEHPAGAEELPVIPYIDKLIHAIMMGGLTGAAVFDYKRAHRAEGSLTAAVMYRIVLAVMLFSFVDEIAQEYLTDARGGEVGDFVADGLGIGGAFFLAPPVVCRLLRVSR